MDVRQPWFVAGFLAGFLAAAAAVLSSTPLSGRALRQAILAHFEHAQEAARVAGREAEAEVLTRYRGIRGTPAEALQS
jgi:hypothetical protein